MISTQVRTDLGFSHRLIYDGLKPDGYPHIEIDIWEKNYSAEF